MLAQQASGNVEAYLQPEAPEHLVLHTVRAPTWLVGRCFCKQPYPVTCDRRLSGMWRIDPSDSSACQTILHLAVVVNPQVKEKIYDQRENGRCPTTWKDSGIIPPPDSSFGENDSFPEPRERGPKVRDWPLNRETISFNEETGFPLNDETRFPLRGDWLADFFPATWGEYATSCPRAMLAQQASGNVEAYLQPEAPEHLVLHTVRAPTWLVGRCFCKQPYPVTCDRRLSGMWRIDPSDSSACQTILHLAAVVNPQVKEKIYDQRENGRCPTTWKDSGIIPPPDPSFGENDIARQIGVA
jgi:hypothetical protein